MCKIEARQRRLQLTIISKINNQSAEKKKQINRTENKCKSSEVPRHSIDSLLVPAPCIHLFHTTYLNSSNTHSQLITTLTACSIDDAQPNVRQPLTHLTTSILTASVLSNTHSAEIKPHCLQHKQHVTASTLSIRTALQLPNNVNCTACIAHHYS